MQLSGAPNTIKLGALMLSLMMLIMFLVPTETADASQGYYSTTPCPHYSIQNVFDDPNSDWDNDRIGNSDELYNGLNPCVVDSAALCNVGSPLCRKVVIVTSCATSVAHYPHGDYDGDGVSNATELRHYADPCSKPCPHPARIDIALNPHGNWDGDKVNNQTEVRHGTNPCNGYSYNPCPHWNQYDLNNMPGFDWDYDGVNNVTEVRRGTSPCHANTPRLPHVTNQPTTQRPPHVHQTPPKPQPRCPHGYPYYHPGTNLCYANPIGHVYYR